MARRCYALSALSTHAEVLQDGAHSRAYTIPRHSLMIVSNLPQRSRKMLAHAAHFSVWATTLVSQATHY
jgi:hypothetical protein